MRRWRWVLIGAAIVAAALAAAAPAGEGARTLKRTEDPIVLTGAKLVGAQGWEIAKTRVFAFRNGQATAIPFQIDERDAKGQYVPPFGGGKKSDDGVIGPKDEFVMMIADAGDQGSRDKLPGGPDAAVQLEFSDPVDGGKAWAYLARYPDAAPALSPVDYVQYNNATTTIETTRFRMAFHQKARLSIGTLALKEAGGGGGGQNLIDRLKIRFHTTIVGVGMELDRNEEDFLSQTVGWIDGPVRIVRHTVNQVQLWKIKSPKAYTDNVYYVNAFEFPTVVEFALGSDLLMKDPKFRVSSDGLCSVPGRLFYNSNNQQGVKIDGVMSEAEKTLDRGPYTWSLVTDPSGRGAWMNRLLYDSSATPVKPNLYYNDDRNSRDGPEDEPGECGDIGYTLENLGQLKRNKLYLQSIMYNINSAPTKRVQEYLNILDRPVQAKATAL
jgi:hypothetical protein